MSWFRISVLQRCDWYMTIYKCSKYSITSGEQKTQNRRICKVTVVPFFYGYFLRIVKKFMSIYDCHLHLKSKWSLWLFCLASEAQNDLQNFFPTKTFLIKSGRCTTKTHGIICFLSQYPNLLFQRKILAQIFF